MNRVIPEGVWLLEVNYDQSGTVRVKGNSLADQNILEFIDFVGSLKFEGYKELVENFTTSFSNLKEGKSISSDGLKNR